jgi:dephospho-CoA kinase
MSLPVQRIGLTGGIGSGKSEVARVLASCGAAVVDADAISRGVTAAGGSAIENIAQEFGRRFIAADGSLDREQMRQLAFSDPDARRRLETIIHPLVRLETVQQTEKAVAEGKRCIVFDVPLLVESGNWRPLLDKVIVVDCPEATQLARVLAREAGRAGWSAETVRRIVAGQAPRAQRLAAADICIYNEGISLEGLAARVRQVARSFGL